MTLIRRLADGLLNRLAPKAAARADDGVVNQFCYCDNDGLKFSRNCIVQAGGILICEACEFRGTFCW